LMGAALVLAMSAGYEIVDRLAAHREASQRGTVVATMAAHGLRASCRNSERGDQCLNLLPVS
jgi:hypothetical protein